MRRPPGVTTIATASLLFAVYQLALVFIEISRLHAAGLVNFPFRYALSMPGTYIPLVGSLVWSLIAWGLFRLQNWARMAAALLLGIGLAFEVTNLAMGGRFHWWMVVEMFVQLVVIWYFFRVSVLDRFLKPANPL
jgi:uncharacterized membrane protein (DUF2068 family)